MESIELVLSQGIKYGKWINISYKNNHKEITCFWIAVKDVDLLNKRLFVSIFNDQKSLYCLDATIKFENILSAKILEFTTFDTPIELIHKLENNRCDAKWLRYESFNNNILRYYLKCNELDNDPFHKDTFLIPGIDKTLLLNNKNLVLDEDRESCDTRKSIICKENDIVLLEIPNSFAKSYEIIKELILLSCGQQIEQLELF